MPRIQFRHIKRAEEVPPAPPAPPAPAPSVSPVRVRRVDVLREPATWPDVEMSRMDEWCSMRVSRQIMDHEPEATWRTYVYEHARKTGYGGTMSEFFCRDCQETIDRDSYSIRFTWRKTPDPSERYNWGRW